MPKCKICGGETPEWATHTELCNGCWELERNFERLPQDVALDWLYMKFANIAFACLRTEFAKEWEAPHREDK